MRRKQGIEAEQTPKQPAPPDLLDASACPEDTVTVPPTPVKDVPVSKEMAPEAPPVAAPVPMATSPDAPDLVVPLLNTRIPESPNAVASLHGEEQTYFHNHETHG
jgi:hypothetical protein